MTKHELKGRLLELIAQVDDKSALVDMYRFMRTRLEWDGAEASSDLEMPEPSGPDSTSEGNNPLPVETFPYPQYFSY